MNSKIFSLLSLIVISFTLAGCNGSSVPDGGVYKSTDAGKTFSQKIKIDEKQNIGTANVLAIEFDPTNYNTVYLGTSDQGILRSTDAGETWVKDANNFRAVDAIAIDPTAPQTIYITALKGSRGKIMKTTNGGQEWAEALTQDVDGPIFTALAIDKVAPNVLYAGDSRGAIYKTDDAGQTWRTLYWEKNAIQTIAIDNANTNTVYFGTNGGGLLVTQDEGTTFSRIKESGTIYTVVPHPSQAGVLYVTDKDGIHRSNDTGATWQTIGTLVKPQELAARAFAVDPFNDNVLYFSSGRAFYKSTNGGNTWATVQFNMNRSMNVLKINPADTNVLYAGFSTPAKNYKLLPF